MSHRNTKTRTFENVLLLQLFLSWTPFRAPSPSRFPSPPSPLVLWAKADGLLVVVGQILPQANNPVGLLVGQPIGRVEPQRGKEGFRNFRLGMPLNIVRSNGLLTKKIKLKKCQNKTMLREEQ